MADDALEFAVNESTFLHSKFNKKLRFVGTGLKISVLSPTNPGQVVFCTVTGSGFTAGKTYIRNAANNAWTEYSDITAIESSEFESTIIASDIDFVPTSANRWYDFHTLPSTEKFYIVTKLEWINGATISGNIICGVDLVDSTSPSITNSVLLGVSSQVAQAGVSSTQSVSMINCNPIPAGNIVGFWISIDNGTGTVRAKNITSVNVRWKANAFSSTPPSQSTAGWNASVTRVSLKAYFRGYKQL